MLPQPLDTLLAFKIIGLSENLSSAEKRVAAAILDSFNRKTGRCDPSLDRIAHLVLLSRRTVIRSVKKIEMLGLIIRHRHGGKFHCNSYAPNWVRIREAEVRWVAKKKTRHWDDTGTKVSPTGCQSSHLAGDENVPQTYPINIIPETSKDVTVKSTNVRSAKQQTNTEPTKSFPLRIASHSSSSSKDVAINAAERRWTSALDARFRATPQLYAEILDAIDPELSAAATTAELEKRGTGLHLVLARLSRA